jgi:hypothetical protein
VTAIGLTAKHIHIHDDLEAGIITVLVKRPIDVA